MEDVKTPIIRRLPRVTKTYHLLKELGKANCGTSILENSGLGNGCHWQEGKSMEDVKILVFQGLPRESKTYAALWQLRLVNSGIYLSAKHEIIDQSFDRFSCPVGKTAVKMEGKSRLCKTRTLNCSACPMKPDETDINHIGYFDLKLIAENLLEKHCKVSKDEVKSAETDEIIEKYGGLCPYYTLKLVMERCNYIFTVPQIEIPKENVDLLIIDEEPTLSSFFPQCAEICSYSHLPDRANTQIEIPDFQFVVDQIEQKDRKLARDRDVLKAIDILNRWREILISFKDGKISKEQVIPALIGIPAPEFEDPDTAYQYVSKHLVADEHRVFFDPIFYPALISVHEETGRWNNRIYAIADCELQIRQFPSSDRILMIGATLAEKIAVTCEPDACKVLEFKKFQYAKNFVIFPVEDKQEVTLNGKTYTRLDRDKTQKDILDIARELYRQNIPCIIVNGTEETQRQAERNLREMKVSPLVTQQETVAELYDSLLTARPNLVYANSNVSRGIDLDPYDVILIYHAEFSTPYWSAMVAYWKDRDSNKASSYQWIREQILVDETVNLAFRIAPIKKRWKLYPKIMFIPSYYLDRLRARCAELGVLDKLERAISKVTICSQNTDLEYLGNFLRAQIRTVDKHRGNLENTIKSDSDSSEVSDICNLYKDLVPNNPILGTVLEDRLVETVDGFMLADPRRFFCQNDKPTYLEEMIRDLIIECLRTKISISKKAIPTMEIIDFVQIPPPEWISNHLRYPVMPDTHNTRGRPQKYFATRDQIRKVLNRMVFDGVIKRHQKGSGQSWSPTTSVSSHTGNMVHTAQPLKVGACSSFENLGKNDPSIDKSAAKTEEVIFE